MKNIKNEKIKYILKSNIYGAKLNFYLISMYNMLKLFMNLFSAIIEWFPVGNLV